MMKNTAVVLTILVVIFLSASVSASDNKVTMIHTEYDHGDVSIINIDVRDGHPPVFHEDSGNYTLRVADDEGQTLQSLRFDFDRAPAEYLEEDSHGHSNELLEHVEETVVLEYREETSVVSLYNQNMSKIDEMEVETASSDEEVEEDEIHSLIALLLILIIAGLVYLGLKKRRSKPDFENSFEDIDLDRDF